MDYELIIASTKEALRDLIEEKTSAGWLLLGKITKATWTTGFYQAIAKLSIDPRN